MSPPRILLVEDDDNDEELARIALEDTAIPHQLTVARDGARALDLLFASTDQDAADPSPALILLDLKVPKVSGIELLGRIRREERTRFVPVVVFTSSAEERDLDAAYDGGANAYLRKPVDFREYRELVAAAVTFWIRYNQLPPGAGRAG